MGFVWKQRRIWTGFLTALLFLPCHIPPS
jgi:hypothetical protein